MKNKKDSKDELMPISLIYISNFPKNLRETSDKLFNNYEVEDDKSAFQKLENNINNNILYNVILSGHKTIEDAYGLLKKYLDYNIESGYCFDNSNYPFFLFIENEKLNKKKLYAYYLENEKKREEPLEAGLGIDSKNILFSNFEYNVKDKLNSVMNYYHRKDVSVKNFTYYSPYIKFMFVGVTGTGKSTMINELNGEKISYSSSENHIKTRLNKDRKLIFKNRKYPILNQDTEGFEIADNTQIDQVNNNINKNEGIEFNERLHIVIYLVKNERGLDNNDFPLLVKLHQLKILYYILWPRKEGMDQLLKGKGNRTIKSLISNLEKNEPNTQKIFKDLKLTNTELINILKEMSLKLNKIIFSADIMAGDSKGKINLLEKIKKDLENIYKIHDNYIKNVESLQNKQEKFKISISGNILLKNEDNITYLLDDSPFFYKFSIDDIKRKEAEKLLDDYDVSALWLLWYNGRVERLRKNILESLKKIYSEVKVDAEIDFKNYLDNESSFYKTECTKKFIENLIDFFAEKYKELELNKKYYSLCKEYNESIKQFYKYVEEVKNMKLNEEQVRYDIDFI